VLQFIAGKPAVYFSANQKLRGPQIADLMRAAAAALSRPELADAGPVTWEAPLRLVVAAAPEGARALRSRARVGPTTCTHRAPGSVLDLGPRGYVTGASSPTSGAASITGRQSASLTGPRKNDD
jgi:hypothetical protein